MRPLILGLEERRESSVSCNEDCHGKRDGLGDRQCFSWSLRNQYCYHLCPDEDIATSGDVAKARMLASIGARQKPKPPCSQTLYNNHPLFSSEMRRNEGVWGNDRDAFVSRRKIIFNGVCFSMSLEAGLFAQNERIWSVKDLKKVINTHIHLEAD